MNLDMLVPLIAYLLFVFGVAFYAYQKRKGQSFLNEYYMGSRSMSGFVLAMTTAATYVGASSFIGGPGAAYKFGLGWVLLAMIQVPVVILTLGVLGKRFAILARKTNSVTINDLLYARYKNRFVVWVASFSLLISFFAMMTVQFFGAGRLLETTLGIPYQTAILIFALTIGIYTFIGGFRAVVLTDTIQGIVMIVGTTLLLGGVIYATGGVSAAIKTLENIDPNLISPYGIEARPLDFTFMLSFWVLVCFGIMGLPTLVVRSMAYKDSKALHQGIIIGTVVVAFLMLGMHLSGVLGRALDPNLTVSDKIIPTLMLQVMPPMVAGIFLAAPMAAIMSSIDSMLIQASSTLIKDLYIAIKPEAIHNETKIKRLSTLTTLVFTLLLIIAALNPPDMLIWLNLNALGGLEATFFWVILLGFLWKKANAMGAIFSMIGGLGSYGMLVITEIKFFNFHAIVPAIFVGLIAFLIGNILQAKK
ncbi:sodium/pantothenate symporter [Pasteurella atlantica]|uniref:sodium/pantothenate symporter n=1 Tax=Pasteurellaceae TaxID=712 RepID=UPI00276713A2|nr:sodium/pantothenate symporter [Pasteurella atlantica]MDP8098661.1 sodium/pantothenate symporter [Pasteurella atlantica]MDP8106647.1 sodium/pantothenate symporter [Pasteurella atlantica]MDP8116338.1 sodium/pantothenate symporter [Pasteurella atlantica]